MKLTIEGIKDRAAWEKAGIALPGYDVEKIFSVYLSAALQTDFWKKVYWTEESPV